jgi:sulfate adenylyltransferase
LLVKPHGHSELSPRLVDETQRTDHLAEAKTLRSIRMTSRELSDLLMFGMGAYSPLEGFMNEESWRKCCTDYTTDQGLFWPIPITVSVPEDVASSISLGETIALIDENATIYGTLKVDEKYTIDKELECREVYKTLDPEHPGVEKVMSQEPINLAGAVTVLNEGVYPATYKGLYLKPEETRSIFEKNNWSTVAAFQTRNPMHRSHEHLAKIAIEICDGLLIHQVLGALKPGDIPADIRVAAIDALVENYFVPGTAIQAGYPIEMRYAGPREALLHALFRQNFGCSHLVVGRDHAGVGDYYGPFDAHHIFDEIPKGSLETQPLKIDIAFYSYKCGGMATGRTCPSDESQRLNISGTRLREMLANGEPVPEEFSRPEVIQVLRRHYDA